MQAGDPFAPFFTALRSFNDIAFGSAGAGDVAAAYRRNLDAIEQANRVIMDGAMEASRRQSEVLRIVMSDIAKAAQQITSAPTPIDAAKFQAQFVETAVSGAIDRMRDVNDAFARANADALDVLRQRLIDSIDEAVGSRK